MLCRIWGMWVWDKVTFCSIHSIMSERNPMSHLKKATWWPQLLPTCLFGNLREGFNTFFSITSFGCESRHVVPAKGLYDVYHGLGLEGIRWDHTGEEVIAPVIAELWCCGCITNLRDLKKRKHHKKAYGQDRSNSLIFMTGYAKYRAGAAKGMSVWPYYHHVILDHLTVTSSQYRSVVGVLPFHFSLFEGKFGDSMKITRSGLWLVRRKAFMVMLLNIVYPVMLYFLTNRNKSLTS